MKATVEICVEGLRSAIAAGEGEADRIELCENLAVGGVTPSAGGDRGAAKRLDIPVHVLIRPRGGDFRYQRAEIEVMQHDIAGGQDARGASGVVLGLLDPGPEDRSRPDRAGWSKVARPMSVTFHKAFDAARRPVRGPR